MRFATGVALGLSTFLCGLFLLRGALRSFEGELRPLLERRLTSPLRGAAVGALAAALLQSSSAVNAVAVALAGGGLLRLRQAVSLILGANVGTTLTGQLAAFHPGPLGPAAFAAGAVLAFAGAGKLRRGGWALAGLGGLLSGLDLMARALQAGGTGAVHSLAGAGDGAALLTGALITALVQSSSAVTATLVALAEAGILAVRTAVAAVLGSNVGTVVTTLVAGFSSGPAGRRVAAVDLAFNALGAALFLPLLPVLLSSAEALSRSPGRQVAHAHTLFNLVTVALVLPFVDPLCAALERLLPKR